MAPRRTLATVTNTPLQMTAYMFNISYLRKRHIHVCGRDAS